jgi:hypothetical protein
MRFPKKDTVVFTFRMPRDVHDTLSTLADNDFRSVGDEVRMILKRFVWSSDARKRNEAHYTRPLAKKEEREI